MSSCKERYYQTQSKKRESVFFCLSPLHLYIYIHPQPINKYKKKNEVNGIQIPSQKGPDGGGSRTKEEDDVYHFIAYTLIRGVLYKPSAGPQFHMEVNTQRKSDWGRLGWSNQGESTNALLGHSISNIISLVWQLILHQSPRS